MKMDVPCQSCGKERLIDTKKFSVARYLARSPNCRPCATKQPELLEKISKGWFTSERLFGNKNREGKTPWNKGRTGYMGANKTSFKTENMIGEKNVNWKGGVTPLNAKERNSPEARSFKKTVLRRDDYTCQACGERGGRLEVDHVMPWAHFPDIRFEVLNGQTLCKLCHEKTATYKNRTNIYA